MCTLDIIFIIKSLQEIQFYGRRVSCAWQPHHLYSWTSAFKISHQVSLQVAQMLNTINIKTKISIWPENMLRYLSTDIMCSEKQTVFGEGSLGNTVSFEEQIVSKGKYPNMFSKSNGGYWVYYPSNTFCNMRSWKVTLCCWGLHHHFSRL